MSQQACCIETISRHASVRSYTGDPIPEEHLRRILEAARRAPTGWNLQPFTIVVVRDRGRLRELADLVGGQEHVANAAAFLVFAVDYAKIVKAAEQLGMRIEPRLSNLYEALIDIGIAAGWAALAAESLGYGIVFIALYENPCGVAEALNMPRYVIPAAGIALGKPAEHPAPRKRQPLETLADMESYGDPEEKAKGVLETYGDRAARLFTYIFDQEGYYSVSSELLAKCLAEKGFKLD